MEDDMLALLLSLTALVIVIKRKRLENPRRRVRQKLCISALSGKDKMRELLNGPSTQMYESFRMEKYAFIELCNHFRHMEYLSDSKHLDVEEKMMIFLMTISHNNSNRFMKWEFQHSGETISKYFHEVLWAMLKFAKEMIVPPIWDAPPNIRNHHYLRQGPFKGVVGALDGTLIHAVVPAEKKIPYRARGGKDCWQNVMAICDFDMKFIYAVVGWEGTTHDAKVLSTSVRNPDFKFPLPPSDKYYLCDAAYTHTRGFMTPYRNTRYWLSSWQNGGPPRNKEETFNQAHACLRNVVERTFGVLKARFPILQRMPPYSFPTQRNIVVACMALHNFLRRVTLNDKLFKVYENVDLEVENNEIDDEDENEDGESTQDFFTRDDKAYMVNLRNQIANELVGDGYIGSHPN